MKNIKILTIITILSVLLSACVSPSNEIQSNQPEETSVSQSPEPSQQPPQEEPSVSVIPEQPEQTDDSLIESEQPVAEEAQPLTEDDFVLTVNGQKVRFDQPVDDMIAVMGDDYAYSEAISCAYDGMDKTYGYDSIDIYSYPDGPGDYVNEMFIFGVGVETARGICVGSTRDEVIAAYGEGKSIASMLEYSLGSHLLSFTFSGDIVSDIDLIRE